MQQPFTDIDILFGRGRSFQEREGNRALHHLCDEESLLYEHFKLRDDHKSKKGVILGIIHCLANVQGRRFFKRDSFGQWVSASSRDATKKIRECIGSIINRRGCRIGSAELVSTAKDVQFASAVLREEAGDFRQENSSVINEPSPEVRTQSKLLLLADSVSHSSSVPSLEYIVDQIAPKIVSGLRGKRVVSPELRRRCVKDFSLSMTLLTPSRAIANSTASTKVPLECSTSRPHYAESCVGLQTNLKQVSIWGKTLSLYP